MDKTYLKIFAVLFFISGIVATIFGVMWLSENMPIHLWGFWVSYKMWNAILTSLLMLIMLLPGLVLMGVAIYLHRKAKK